MLGRRPPLRPIAATLEEGEAFRFESIGSYDGALWIRWSGRLKAASEAAVRAAVDLAEARSMCVSHLDGFRPPYRAGAAWKAVQIFEKPALLRGRLGAPPVGSYESTTFEETPNGHRPCTAS